MLVQNMNVSASEYRRGIPIFEYAKRRMQVLKSLRGAAAVVFAGDGSPPLLGKWRPDFHFLYLTGIDDEPGAAILFNPAAEEAHRRITLLLRPIDVERDRWDGYREQIGSPLRKSTGFETVTRAGSLPALLTAAARRTRRSGS